MKKIEALINVKTEEVALVIHTDSDEVITMELSKETAQAMNEALSEALAHFPKN